MSYVVFVEYDKPLTGLHNPPNGRKPREVGWKQLGKLPGIYYVVGSLGSKPLTFATHKSANDIAKLIPGALVEKEDDL